MKNFIKTITIFGIATFVSPVHSMEQRQKDFYFITVRILNMVNPSSKKCPILHNGRYPLPPNHLFHTDESFLLKLSAIRVLEQSDKMKNADTLKIILGGIGKGVPVTSKYNIDPVTIYFENEPSKKEKGLNIFFSQNPVSMFTLIENWLKHVSSIDEDRINALMNTIFKGGCELEKRLAGICNKWIDSIQSKLRINIPEDIMLLILAYDENYGDGKENIARIKQAEQKFCEKQQS